MMRAVVLIALAVSVCVQSEAPRGYVLNKAAGKAYKVMYQAQSWTRAKVECEANGATLAVPKSPEEFEFLQRLVRGLYYPHVVGSWYKLLVWLGISNLEDYTVWKNIDGENINKTGFSKWASNFVAFSNDPKEPHCAGMDAVNNGLRDYWCHLRQPYICQLQVNPSEPPTYNQFNEPST
ncbi:hypothetical protein HW555_006160 [Spodoptera exigua]|uniref:C-type lectin domain-containing protein n=1 Tax=Spodoptera exigua TaxID=7107 RepID=A0A835L5L4_SPOEX|nr:hypothetical protein HW555_006160 [Spodoptera exigua]